VGRGHQSREIYHHSRLWWQGIVTIRPLHLLQLTLLLLLLMVMMSVTILLLLVPLVLLAVRVLRMLACALHIPHRRYSTGAGMRLVLIVSQLDQLCLDVLCYILQAKKHSQAGQARRQSANGQSGLAAYGTSHFGRYLTLWTHVPQLCHGAQLLGGATSHGIAAHGRRRASPVSSMMERRAAHIGSGGTHNWFHT